MSKTSHDTSVLGPKTKTPHENRTVVGTCHHDCPDSCGWQASTENGRLVKLKANPKHPFSAKQLCPKVNKFVERVNHADRLLHPLIRTGEKGLSQFRRASWQEALDHIFEQVTQRIEEFGPQTVLAHSSAGTQGLIQNKGLSKPFFAGLGASGTHGSICGKTAATGMKAVLGASLGADPLEMVHSELVILWGTNTRLTNRHLWPYVEQAQANGAKLIVIDPIKTITAEKADWHIAPLPGTDSALWAAIAHLIIAKGQCDDQFVGAHTSGFNRFAEILKDCTPQWASGICGLSPETIEQLQVEYCKAKPAMIRGLIGAEHHRHGALAFSLAVSVATLVGSWKQRGGGFAASVGSWANASANTAVFDLAVEELRSLTQLSAASSDIAELDEPVEADALNKDGETGVLVAEQGFGPPRTFLHSQLGRTLCDTTDVPITALFSWNENPVVSLPNANQIKQGLSNPELFTVVSEQFMTDTAKYADVVLPAAMQTEQYDVVPAWGHLWLGWNEPAAEPLGEAVSNSELWRRLAERFGIQHPVFARSDRQLVLDSLHESVDLTELTENGFVRLPGTEDHQPYAEGGFHHEDAKAHFPDFDPSEFTAKPNDGYLLHTPKKALRFMNTSYSGLEAHRSKESEPTLEMCCEDAETLLLAEGEMAEVSNERATLKLGISINKNLPKGVVSIPWGYWAGSYGDDHSVVNDLTSDAETDLGGGACYGDTLVKIKRLS